MLRLARPCRRWLVRTIVLAAAAAQALLAAGVPQPAAIKSGAAFPCQSHGCGCASADQCWRACCCFSTAEKLAWAARQGVEPPTFAQATFAQASFAQDTFAQATFTPDAASAKPRGGCCTSTGCTEETPALAATPSATPAAPAAAPTWILSWQAQKCRGLGSGWFGGGQPSTLPPAPADWSSDAPLCGDCLPLAAAPLARADELLLPPG